MKTQIISTYYKPEDCPLKEDRLIVADDGGAWLEPKLYTVISNEWDEEREEGTLIVEVNLPEKPCRFLGHSDGSPPACYGFGNPASHGQPYYMEGVPDGFAPELNCLHCAEYAFEREERQQERDHRLDNRGILQLLPELNAEELGKYADDPPFAYVDRATGEVA